MRRLLIAYPGMVLLFFITQGSAAAQTAPSSSRAYKMPRTADGHPDLQGMYDLATITPIERPSGAPAAYTQEEARKLEMAADKLRSQGDQPIDGNRKEQQKECWDGSCDTVHSAAA